MQYEGVEINYRDLLSRLEVENVSPPARGEITFSCPFTDGHTFGDSTPSANFNIVDNVFFCHACHARGTVVDFIVKIQQSTPVAAMRLLRELYGMEYRAPEGGSVMAEMKAIEERREREQVQQLPPEQPLEQAWLSGGSSFNCDWRNMRMAHGMGIDTGPGSYMFDRGFSVQTLDEWQMGFDTWSDRVTIPVRDDMGNLVGFKGRSIHGDVRPKYLVLGDTDRGRLRYGVGYGFEPYDISHYIFGLHRAKLYESDRLVVCEGELDAVALHQAGVKDAVALGRSYLSDIQISLLCWYASDVVLFFDSLKESAEIGPRLILDKAGQDCTLNAIAALSGRLRVKVVPDHLGDPASMSGGEARRLIDKAKPWTRLLTSGV